MLRSLIKGLLRVAFRVYYRRIDVQGLERLPRRGAVLLVANHPNSLLDPALLTHVLPRAVTFGAKHTLFQNALLRPVLRAFDAIPLVRASDEPQGTAKNAEAFERYAELLGHGQVSAIFPEGITHDEPQLAPLRTGAARIALCAEADHDFGLGLVILPVGLQFYPRSSFRADALVRIGDPVTLDDLKQTYATTPREAVRRLTERIGEALRSVSLHLEDPEKAPLAERIMEVYWARVRETGLGPGQAKALRGELLQRIAAAVNHFQKESPEEIAEIERALSRYERLRQKAGVSRRLLEEPSRLLPGLLAPIQALVEAALGAIPALVGFLTGAIPYFVARQYARRVARQDGRVLGSTAQVVVGVLAFGLFYGALIGLAAWRYSDAATVVLALILIPTGLFAHVYARRMRTIVAHIGDRSASWFKLEAVARVRKARDELVDRLDTLRNRYRREVLGWEPLAPVARRRSKRTAVLRLAGILVPVVLVALLLVGLVDRPVSGLPIGPSPWEKMRSVDPQRAERELRRDARGVLSAAGQLDRLHGEMRVLRHEFLDGERTLMTQRDHDEIHVLLSAYLDLRVALLKAIWLYRGENRDSDDPLEARAFLTAYTAAAVLVEKAWAIHESFRNDPGTMQKLDLGDRAWGIPPGTYSEIMGSLTNLSVMAELQAGALRFDAYREAGRFAGDEPWSALAARAARSRPAIDAALEGVGRRKLRRAFREMVEKIRDPVQEVQPVISMWVSRFRIKERPPHRGLISVGQVEELRAELRPGDILIERRNWYLTNCFLPGFWPHAALYLGTPEELRHLGVATDGRAAPHMDDFARPDERGHDHAVLEAIGEGVIFTSLEHSVGEADAVAILRPVLTDEERREALARALSHRGKQYDFDFDFATSDTLVCTELIFRAYDGILEIPEMELIMGKKRLPAGGYVRMWADGRHGGDPQLELVRFLDFDESNGVAVEADETTLIETLDRTRFTFMR